MKKTITVMILTLVSLVFLMPAPLSAGAGCSAMFAKCYAGQMGNPYGYLACAIGYSFCEAFVE